MSHTSTASNTVGLIVLALIVSAIIAWVLPLPVVGLLYMTGYLS